MVAQVTGQNGTTAALAANPFPVRLFRGDGTEQEPTFLAEFYAASNIPQFTAALAANAGLFAIRNGTTRRVKLQLAELSLSFAGTAAATTMQVSIRRFTTATPTAGTALTIVQEDTANATATSVIDARCATAAAALTTTGLVIGAPVFVAACPRSVTGGVFSFEMNRDMVLNVNEGLIVQYDTIGVIGDALAVTTYWGELV
jgi:hypothetical protein